MSKKTSKQQRIQQANDIHNNKYDYSLWPNDVNLTTKLPIICTHHGIFNQTLKNHIIKKQGCRKCWNDKLGNSRKKNKQYYIDKANKIHNNKYNYSLLTDNILTTSKVDIICPIHGKFTQLLNTHLNGCGCPKCKKEVISLTHKKDKSYFVNLANNKHSYVYDYSLWPDNIYSSKKVDIICPKHGKFKQTLNAHLNGQGCPKCKTLKTQRTNKEKYGSLSWNGQHISNETYKKLNDKKWLIEQHHQNKKNQLEIAFMLGISATTLNRYFKKHNIELKYYFNSIGQQQVQSFLESLNVNMITNDRTIISPHELDIFLPDYQIAIEYNGLYWHSEAAERIDNKYHLNKTKICEEKGIRLIHIFEDEWFNQQQQCKDTITHLLGKSEKGDYARHCTIREITWQQAKQFLNEYHLLGAGASGNYRIGAFNKQNELIGVMVFGQSTSERSNEIELKRFITNKKNNPGLGSKMFKYAIKHQNYHEVIAFVDRRWFTGLVKDHIGFEKVDETPPALWWTNGKERKHRRFKTKRQLTENNGTNKKLSKRNMMENLGWYRIWDCGKIKLKYTK